MFKKTLSILTLCAISALANAGTPNPCAELWENAFSALAKEQPKTALAELEKVVAQAAAHEQWLEYAFAVCMAAEAQRELSSAEGYFARLAESAEVLRAAVENAPSPLARIFLETALADTYKSLSEQHFSGRLTGGNDAEPDAALPEKIAEWSPRQIREAALRSYENVLAQEEFLKKIPTSAMQPAVLFDEAAEARILEKLGIDEPKEKDARFRKLHSFLLGDATPAEYPTLYDIVARDAQLFFAGFFSPEEPAFPENAAIYSDPQTFSELDFADANARKSTKLRALQIAQDRTRFHLNDADKSALARATLERLIWAKEASETKSETADAEYEAALKQFIADYEFFPIAAEAAAALAEFYRFNDREPEAYEIADKAVARYGNTENANACKNLLNALREKNIELFRMPQTWTHSAPTTFSLRAKNVKQIRFRAVPADWRNHLKREFNRPDNLSEKEIAVLHKAENAVEWTEPLEQFYDFRSHAYTLEIPAEKLAPGFYFIFTACDDAPFTSTKNKAKPVPVWISDIAIAHTHSPADRDGNLRLRVVNAVTGDPVEGATVSAWNKARWGGERISVPDAKTDALGEVVLPGLKKDRDPIALVEYAMPAPAAEASSGNVPAQTATHAVSLECIDFEYAPPAQSVETLRIPIFTDRKVYRPGQKISFKGILLNAENSPEKSKVLPGKKVVVSLKRGNKEIATTEAWSNGFGSFAGTITVPKSLGLGKYSLEVKLKEGKIAFVGRNDLQIEEYRRPKSEIAIAAEDKPQILGGNVSAIITGTSFTGAPLDGAKVRWSVSLDAWDADKTPIAQGESILDKSGNLKISWKTERAKLGDNLAKKLSPEERYQRSLNEGTSFKVNAEIVDSNGETTEINEYFTFRNGSCWLGVGTKGLSEPKFADNAIPLCCVAESHSRATKFSSLPVTIEVFRVIEPEKVWSVYPDFSTMKNGEKVFSVQARTQDNDPDTPVASIPAGMLKPGLYRIVASGKDEFGQTISDEAPLQITTRDATAFPLKRDYVFAPYMKGKQDSLVSVGDTAEILWGSGFERARAFVEIFENEKRIDAFYTDFGNTQQILRVPVTETMAGKMLTVRASMFSNGKFFNPQSRPFYVDPKTNLKIEKERVRTTLVPGAAELWTFKISRADGSPATETEIAATLYDVSAETLFGGFQSNDWSRQAVRAFTLPTPPPWRIDSSTNKSQWLSIYTKNNDYDWLSPYSLPHWAFSSVVGYGSQLKEEAMPCEYIAGSGGGVGVGNGRAFVSNFGSENCVFMADGATAETQKLSAETAAASIATDEETSAQASVTTRKNLQETAFFYPFLQTNENGIVTLQFVVPEALTRWRLRLFAHDKNLRRGIFELNDITTAKDLMVQPDAPRFLREGDRIKLPVKLTNTAENELSGEAEIRVEFFGADGKKIDEPQRTPETQNFRVPAKSSTTIFREIDVPDGAVSMTYRATGKSGDTTDGEESALPVLSREVVLTESQTALVRPGETATLAFDKIGANDVRTLAFTLDVPANAYDNVLLALPRLAEQAADTESSDAIFQRFYANALAKKLCDENPEIRKTITAWQQNEPEKFDSPLEATAAQSPYFGVAQRESAQRRAIADFFDANKIQAEQDKALGELQKRLDETGGAGWAWFPGSRCGANLALSREILVGLGRLKSQLAAESPQARAIEKLVAPAIREQDLWLKKCFDRKNERGTPAPVKINDEIAQYFYMRSLFADEKQFPHAAQKAYDYYRVEATRRGSWTKLSRMSQAQLALALWRSGEKEIPSKIVESLRQRAVTTDKLGMFWSDLPTLPLWMPQYSPIETQAAVIELFAEVAQDAKSAEEMQIWLLTRKQTHAWRSARASTDAIFALLLERENESAKQRVPAKVFEATNVEITDADGKPLAPGALVPANALAKISAKNNGNAPIFVSAHQTLAQPLNAVSANAPRAGFSVKKTVFRRVIDRATGEAILEPARLEILRPGDELVVRLTVRADRDFEFVCLKDLRAGGCEPANPQSAWACNNGLWYYAEPRDRETRFYFDRLPTGTHTFEYSQRVRTSGLYSSGFAEIQSLYAPEFSAHSASESLVAM